MGRRSEAMLLKKPLFIDAVLRYVQCLTSAVGVSEQSPTLSFVATEIATQTGGKMPDIIRKTPVGVPHSYYRPGMS